MNDITWSAINKKDLFSRDQIFMIKFAKFNSAKTFENNKFAKFISTILTQNHFRNGT